MRKQRHATGEGLAMLTCLAASAVFAFTPVNLDWKFEGDVSREPADSGSTETVATMKLGGFAADEALAGGEGDFVFRSWDLGEDEAEVIKRYPPTGLYIFIR